MNNVSWQGDDSPFFNGWVLYSSRGHKRKLDEAKGEEDAGDSVDESTKDSNEEEGSSSEADEMAAALDAELNDFM